MAKPKQAPSDAPQVTPELIIEDSTVPTKEPAKPVTVTELPNGVVIEDY